MKSLKKLTNQFNQLKRKKVNNNNNHKSKNLKFLLKRKFQQKSSDF